jgi:hypothetical protein
MMRRKFLTIVAIALLLVLGSGALQTVYANRVQDFTQLHQAQPECKGDPDDCE